eukprot:PhF_6_TR34845/c0_g1_i1/m.50598/K05609/UCHL3, YUH1; ubiquitin carboxyl-terminal hydrolase L3
MSGEGGRKVWFPLESNPEVMNSYVKFLGLEGGTHEFCDVYGFDDDLLEMVPKPVKAVLMLFPITDQNTKFMEDKVRTLSEGTDGPKVSPNVFFMNQLIGNACGTIGILHALSNCRDELTLKDNGFLKNFFTATASMTARNRGEFLVHDEQLDAAQEVAAQQGQTSNQQIEAQINLHFVCFVVKDGFLYELDGCKPFPVNWGPSSEDTLLKDACGVVSKFMALDPEERNFSVVALSK